MDMKVLIKKTQISNEITSKKKNGEWRERKGYEN